jgi:hypothetical protein
VSLSQDRDILREIRKEYGEILKLQSEAVKQAKALDGVARTILDSQQGTSRFSERELRNQVRKAASAIAESERLADLADERARRGESISDEEMALIKAKQSNFTIEKKILAASKKELEFRKAVNKSLGVTGALATSLSKTFGVDLADFLEDAVEKAEDVNRAFQKTGNVFDKFKGDLEVSLLNLKGIGQAVLEGFTSTEAIFVGVLNSFLEFSKANQEVRNLTGQTADNFNDFNSSLVNATDQVNTIASLSKNLGINVNAAFSPETILRATELTELLGVSEESAANIALRTELFGGDAVDNAMKVTQELALSRKGAVNFRDIIETSAGASGKLQATLGQTPGALEDAAGSALALGINLEAAERAADGLLNFEESIKAELEAELLTGRQINLERARNFALNNNIAGLTEEIANNQEILQAFSSGNRIQQEAISRALGLSSSEISNIIFKQKLNAGFTEEQARKAADINEETATQLALNMRIEKSFAKITTALAPLLETFSSLVSNAGLLYTTLGLIAAVKLGPLIMSVGKLIVGLFTSALEATALNAALTFGAGALAIAAAVAATAAIINAFSPPDDAEDGVIGADGRLVVKGPRGSVRLASDDTIVANRNGVIAGTNLMGGSNRELIGRIDKLIAATERGRVMEIDGNLVGKSVANTTSRLG